MIPECRRRKSRRGYDRHGQRLLNSERSFKLSRQVLVEEAGDDGEIGAVSLRIQSDLDVGEVIRSASNERPRIHQSCLNQNLLVTGVPIHHQNAVLLQGAHPLSPRPIGNHYEVLISTQEQRGNTVTHLAIAANNDRWKRARHELDQYYRLLPDRSN